jgi:hypothetical protein
METQVPAPGRISLFWGFSALGGIPVIQPLKIDH